MTTVTRRPARLRAERLEDRATPATFTVTTLADAGSGSLREAVGLANATSDADTIDFAPSLGNQSIGLQTADNPVHGPSALYVSTPIVIRGSGQTLFNATHPTSALWLFLVLGPAADAEGDLTLRNLTLTGGRAVGANGGRVVDGDAVDGRGGAVLNVGGTVRVDGCTLTANEALGGGAGNDLLGGGDGLGGAVFNDGGSLVVVNSTFSGNTARGGDALNIVGQSGGDGGGGLGGAIANRGGTVVMANSTVAGNTARGGEVLTGGAGNNGEAVDPLGGDGFGGGLYNYDGSVTLTNVTFAGGVAAGGGTDGPSVRGGAAGDDLYNAAVGEGVVATVRVGNSVFAGRAGSGAGRTHLIVRESHKDTSQVVLVPSGP